jgi:hypothetical protein
LIFVAGLWRAWARDRARPSALAFITVGIDTLVAPVASTAPDHSHRAAARPTVGVRWGQRSQERSVRRCGGVKRSVI